ncbi:MAG: SUMF1/EgtB/PvdO family nonheme iron enzyme [Verrucomicrobia bacterium]|nr:SUMF1/EgtB/PvdO family nonheme iron enzyme [Verrucomicrobiota bacterium]
MDELRAKAEKGDAQAQTDLGRSYFNGYGVARDKVEAVKWYRKAAEQNYAEAQCILAHCYISGEGVAMDGEGVARDRVEERKWRQKASEQRKAEAMKWYRKAAEQNYAKGQSRLGMCYEFGYGVAKDYVEAVKWWRKAAEQNDPAAQMSLANCYANGRGVAKDDAEAYKWWAVCEARGMNGAKESVTKLEGKMSPEQIAEGKRRGIAFRQMAISSLNAPQKAAGGETVAELRAKAEPKGKPFVNSLGMKFVPVPGTPVLFSIWDTRVQDYQAFVSATGRSWKPRKERLFLEEPTHPAVMVSWDDAKEFCAWLTEKEQRAGMLKPTQGYRLPTDLEWSAAVGLPAESGKTPSERNGRVHDVYPWGSQWPPPWGAGNYNQSLKVDVFEFASPVGSFAPNRFGLYDMGGNVWQWCEEFGVVRGGYWDSREPVTLLSSFRESGAMCDETRVGFRVVLMEGILEWITASNYGRIRRGMALSDVQRILRSKGQPGTSLEWPRGVTQRAGAGGVVYTWVEGERTISLMFFERDGVAKLEEGFFHESGLNRQTLPLR